MHAHSYIMHNTNENTFKTTLQNFSKGKSVIRKCMKPVKFFLKAL